MSDMLGDFRSAFIYMQAITKLLHLTPSSAILLMQDETGATVSEEEVPSALIQRDDLLKVDYVH